jgi:NADPH2:quinone reductase
MKAIGLTDFGGPEVLKVIELPEPQAGPGEVRIRVHAAAVNPTDLTFRSGGRASQLADLPAPYIPGMDVAGVIDQLGTDTDDRLSIGDTVIAYVIPMGPHGGTYAEQVVVAQESVVHAPANLDAAHASTLLLNAATARLALDALALDAGTTIAIVGAAGAVGGYAIQLAKTDGLTVLAVAGEADHSLMRELGADLSVEPAGNVAEQIRAQLPGGAPGVIDAAALDAAALAAIADSGGLATLKGWNGPSERKIRIHPISSFGSATDTALLDRIRALAEAGVLTTRVAEVLPANHAAEAHRRLAAGGLRGRLVLDFTQPL